MNNQFPNSNDNNNNDNDNNKPGALLLFDIKHKVTMTQATGPSICSSSSPYLAERRHPSKETIFTCLYFQSFGHYPNSVTTGESWNVDGPVNRELFLLAQLSLYQNRLAQRPHYY